ncbi:MAG TPA: multiprotein bridging factor aMBF1 [Candidatus Nanoarchaeia archaeon]|nr:multiprotein bridging factor aMBF1 [Candidatus Nanoarchaeia archaeon]
MASCDMCGKETSLVTVEVEKVEMKVCQNCAKYGAIKKQLGEVRLPQKKMHTEPAFLVAGNYAGVLRQAREKQKLSQEDFAKFLQERESIVAKWEQGKMQPSVEVARRLEKVLGVSLVVEDVEQAVEKEKNVKSDGFTLGDFMKVRKKV